MAGVGEASAVLSTIQIGLSLAKTLYACVGDYRSAREEITALATDVEATLTQAQELDELIAHNATHQLLNERGLKLAEKCCNDSKLMVQKLLKLLTKTGVPERRAQAIGLTDIDVSKFGRAAWVLTKPEVLVTKRELDSIKLTMLVARSCIDAQSASNSADRDAALSRIAGLERSRMLARRLLREAKADNIRSTQSAASYTGVPAAETFSTRSEPPPRTRPVRRPSSIAGTSHRQPQRVAPATALAPIPAAPASLDGHAVESVAQQIQRDEEDLRQEQKRLRDKVIKELDAEEKARKAREIAEKVSREQAVEAYKEDVRRRLNASRDKSERMRAQLVASFSQELAEAEVQKFIEAQNAQELQDDFVALMIDEYKAPQSTSVASPNATSWDESTAETRRDRKGWLSRLLRPADRDERDDASEASDSRGTEARFVHLLLTVIDGKRSILALENSAFTHAPCASACNISHTTKSWTSLAEADQDAAFMHLATAHPLPPFTHWHLHSAWSTGYQSSRRRRFLERALLGDHRVSRNCSYVLAFSAAFSWQEMLKGAAERSERAQDRFSATDSEQTAVATVAEPAVQTLKSKESQKRPEATGATESSQPQPNNVQPPRQAGGERPNSTTHATFERDPRTSEQPAAATAHPDVRTRASLGPPSAVPPTAGAPAAGPYSAGPYSAGPYSAGPYSAGPPTAAPYSHERQLVPYGYPSAYGASVNPFSPDSAYGPYSYPYPPPTNPSGYTLDPYGAPPIPHPLSSNHPGAPQSPHPPQHSLIPYGHDPYYGHPPPPPAAVSSGYFGQTNIPPAYPTTTHDVGAYGGGSRRHTSRRSRERVRDAPGTVASRTLPVVQSRGRSRRDRSRSLSTSSDSWAEVDIERHRYDYSPSPRRGTKIYNSHPPPEPNVPTPATFGKGKTRMPKRLVRREAIMDLGYPYDEETDFFVLRVPLQKEQIDEVIRISESYKNGEGLSERQQRRTGNESVTFQEPTRSQPIPLPWYDDPVEVVEHHGSEQSAGSDVDDVEAKAIDDDILSQRTLSKYTTGSVGGFAGDAGGADDAGSAMSSDAGDTKPKDGMKSKSVGFDWGFSGSSKLADGFVGDGDAKKAAKDDAWDDWGGFATTKKKKKKKSKGKEDKNKTPEPSGVIIEEVDEAPRPRTPTPPPELEGGGGAADGQHLERADGIVERQDHDVPPPPPPEDGGRMAPIERRPTVTIEEGDADAQEDDV